MSGNIQKLTRIFLKLDYRDKENSGKRKLTGILIAYFFSNLFISFNNYRNFDETSFVILALTTNVFLLAFVILGDFSNLFFTKTHYELLSSLPVKDSEIFISKFISAFGYISFFSAAIIAPQAIFFFQYGGSIAALFLFLAVCFLFNIFFISILLLFYALAISYLQERSSIFVYIVQFGFVIFVIFSSSFSSKAALEGKRSLLGFEAVGYLPQAYFTRGIYEIPMLLICAAASFILLAVFYYFVSKNYGSLSAKVYSLKKRPKKGKVRSPGAVYNFIYRHILKNNHERASYNLLKYQLANSRTMRLRYIPMLFFPIIFCLVGVFSNSKFLLVLEPGSKSAFLDTIVPLMSPSITFALIMSVRILISNTKISEEVSPDTLWIYKALPVDSISSVTNGIRKYVFINFIIPVIFVLAALMSIRLDFMTVLLNLAYVTAFMLFINSIMQFFDKTYPFTLENSKFNSTSKFIEILFTILLGIIIFVSQIFVFQNIIFVVASVIILTGISVLLNRK